MPGDAGAAAERVVIDMLCSSYKENPSKMKLRSVLALALLLGVAVAHAQEAPKVRKQGGATYVSGGTLEEERKALFKLAPRFPIQLIFQLDGEIAPIEGVKVSVRDIGGNVLIEAVSDGPFFYCNPPAGGRFTIDVEYNGQKQSQTKDLVGRRYLVLEYKFTAN